MFRVRSVLLLSLCLLSACGGSQKEAQAPQVLAQSQDASVAGVQESVDVPLTQLERAEVAATVEAGLGSFLQQVELEESLKEGEFEGFRIVRFTEPARWRGVGLQPGDVILSVNDASIERPEQAYAVFVSLKTADVLEVAYLRGGQPMRLSLPIKGEPSPSESAPAAKPKAKSSVAEPPAAQPKQR